MCLVSGQGVMRNAGCPAVHGQPKEYYNAEMRTRMVRVYNESNAIGRCISLFNGSHL